MAVVRDPEPAPEPRTVSEQARAELDEAAAIVAEAMAGWPLRPSGRVLAAWHVAVARLLHELVPVAAILAGIAACGAKGIGSHKLAEVTFETANRRPVSRADRAVADLQALKTGPGLSSGLFMRRAIEA